MSDDKLKISVNPDSFTMGDLEDFEEYVGKPLTEAVKKYVVKDDDGNPVRDEKGRPEMEVRLSAKAMTGLLWIVLRQDNPSFTKDDARKIKPSTIEWEDVPEAPEGGATPGN